MRQRLVIVAVKDELLELDRAGDVATLAHVHEAQALVNGEGLEPRDAHLTEGGLGLANLDSLSLHLQHGIDGLDVLGRGAATTTEHVDNLGLDEDLE